MEPIVDAIYEAALDPGVWVDVLEQTSQTTGAVGGLLLGVRSDGAVWVTSPGLTPVMNDFVAEGWHERNQRAEKLLAAREPRFLTDQEVFSAEEIAASPQYQRFLIPRRMAFGAATGISGALDDQLILTFEGYADGDAARTAAQTLNGLRPHFARAALVASRLRLQRARAGVEVLEMIGIPAAVLSAEHRIVAANASLRGLLDVGAVHESRSRLRFADARAAAILADALDRMSRGGSGRSLPLRLAQPYGAAVVHLLPMRGEARDVFGGGLALLAVTLAGRGRSPGTEVLRGLFDLTAAEARLTHLLVTGGSLPEVAAKLEASPHTLRSQLKSVFAKTGMRRQAELVAAISGLALRTPPTSV